MSLVIIIIQVLTNLFILLVVVDAVLSFFVSPLHPVRTTIGRILDPLLAPIRRILPPLGGFDFSPLVLIILVQIISSLLVRFL